jgi:hypothetical protein
MVVSVFYSTVNKARVGKFTSMSVSMGSVSWCALSAKGSGQELLTLAVVAEPFLDIGATALAI